MATIDTVTDSGEAQAAEPEATPSISPPVAAQVMAPVNPQTAAAQRSMTVVVTVFGAIITALLGGMFLFMISAIDDVRDEISALRSEMHDEISSLRSDMSAEIGNLRSDMSAEINSLRSEMNARFAEVDRKFDQVNAVLMDHTDRLARIETTLGISGRPPSSETDTPIDP